MSVDGPGDAVKTEFIHKNGELGRLASTVTPATTPFVYL